MDPDEAPAEAPEVEPEHGVGVDDADLEAAALDRFGHDEAPVSGEVEPEGDEPSGDDGSGEEADTGDEGREGVPSSPPDSYDLGDGRSLTREEAESWADFQNFLRSNPDAAERVVAALEAQQQQTAPPAAPTAPPAKPTVPEGIDLDDPAIAALWHQHEATLAQMERLQATVEAHDQYVTHAERETTQSLLNTARANYQKEHNLSEAEMQTVYDVAGRLQVLPALLAANDPVTGLPRQIDPLAAMQEAFEIARWNVPELREREMQLKVDDQKADTKRKQKLSSLGGSSGSAPKTPPAPKTEQERREAMIATVAGYLNGEGES